MNRRTKILSIIMAILMLISIVPITAGAINSSDTTTDEETACVHDYKSQIVLPDCTKHGYTTYTCLNCGDTYVEDYVDAFGHTFVEVTTSPTCTSEGYTTYTCSYCNDTYIDNFVNALGHDYESVVTAPTCLDKGYTTYTCSYCNDTYYKDITPATGHNHSAVVTAPTCTEQGYTTYTCSCGDTYVDEYTDATGHTPYFSAITNIVPATCIKKGSQDIVTYCIDCGEEISRVTERTPATGHNYVDGKCVGCGVEDVYYYNGTFRIETPSRTEIRHRDGIKLHTKIDGNAPSGSYVVWTADNDNFITTKINNGQSLKIVSENKGTTVFTATLYSNEGIILDTDSIEMDSKAGFFEKIGSFFRSLFNNTKIYEY